MAQSAPLIRMHKTDMHSIARLYTEEIVISFCEPVGVNLIKITTKIKENFIW